MVVKPRESESNVEGWVITSNGITESLDGSGRPHVFGISIGVIMHTDTNGAGKEGERGVAWSGDLIGCNRRVFASTATLQ